LSLAAAAAVLARVAQARGDHVALAASVVAGATAAACWLLAGHRYGRVTRSLRERGDLAGAPLGPGAAALGAASLCLSLAALRLVLAGPGA
jgi:hypothetical protein